MNFYRLPVLPLLALTGGCAFYGYEDVSLSIRDGSTNQPAPGVTVETFYGHGWLFNPPRRDSATTDEHGNTILRIAESNKMYSTHIYVFAHWIPTDPLDTPRRSRYLVPEEILREGGQLIFEFKHPGDTRDIEVTLTPAN
jgi:hypothetical protein